MSPAAAPGAPAVQVFYDAFELAPARGNSMGIYRYAVELLAALADLREAGVRIVVVTNGEAAADFQAAARGRVEVQVLSAAYPDKWQRLRWRLAEARRAVRRLGATVYFSPKGFLPRLGRSGADGVRSVVVVHDLIPLWYQEVFPGHFSFLERLMVNGGLRRACTGATEVITISRTSAHDIARRTGRTEGVHVVYNGMAPAAAAASVRPVEQPYLFSVSSALPHKNLSGLLAAYRLYRRQAAQPLDLVVCGIAPVEEAGVTAVRRLTDEQLQTYYAHAAAFVFLSLNEGFGFPPLEAMRYGVPVVCSDIAALEETTQGHAVLVDPADPAAVAGALESTTRTAMPAHAAEAAKAAASAYRWDRCARQVLGVLCGRRTGEQAARPSSIREVRQ